MVSRCDKPITSPHNVGGGTMILQRSDKERVITCTGSTTRTFGKTAQLCSIKVRLHRFYSIYMSSPSQEDESHLTDFLKNTRGTIVIAGDLNLKNLDWHSIPTGTRGSTNRWLTLQQERDLNQLVQAPTRLAVRNQRNRSIK